MAFVVECRYIAGNRFGKIVRRVTVKWPQGDSLKTEYS